MNTERVQFTTTVHEGTGGRAYIEVPFDPDAQWGRKERHHVRGTIDRADVRGPLECHGGKWRLSLGPVWRRDNGVMPGATVTVVLAAEGPQRDSLPPDLAAALDAEPDAGAFWDALATFYRKGYLRWLDGAARRPTVRAERVQELVALLKAGRKTRG